MSDLKANIADSLNEIRDLMEIEETGNIDTKSNNEQLFKSNLKIDFDYNRIIFGAPGTGKSYRINDDKSNILKNGGEFERVTFHPDYTYANFVGTYKPVPVVYEDGKEGISYKYVPGPFMRTYVKALKNILINSDNLNNVKPFLLIVEEINRANVAAVFGDIFQLLDRDDDNISEYSIQPSEDIRKYISDELQIEKSYITEMKIPDNMFIWATMNSADQGVYPMDTAFKRRWNFEYIGINDNDEELENKFVVLNTKKIKWNDLRKAINSELSSVCKVNEDKLLGPYFLPSKLVVPKDSDEIDSDMFKKAFKGKVLMYLFDDAARQKRKDLFKGCDDYNIYSKICDTFDKKGIRIFSDNIINMCIVEEKE